MDYGPAPDFLRRLTVEEASILQSFPLSFKFEGSQSSQFQQIGNAVPPNLGRALARMVDDYFKAESDNKLIFTKGTEEQLYFEEFVG